MSDDSVGALIVIGAFLFLMGSGGGAKTASYTKTNQPNTNRPVPPKPYSPAQTLTAPTATTAPYNAPSSSPVSIQSNTQHIAAQIVCVPPGFTGYSNSGILSCNPLTKSSVPGSLVVATPANNPNSAGATAALQVVAGPGTSLGPTMFCTVTGATSAAVLPSQTNSLPSANYIALLTSDAAKTPAALPLIAQFAAGQISFAAFASQFNALVYGN